MKSALINKFSVLRNLSVRAKMMGLAFVLLGGACGTIVVCGVGMKILFDLQAQTEKAFKTHEGILKIAPTFEKLSTGVLKYVAFPSEDAWKSRDLNFKVGDEQVEFVLNNSQNPDLKKIVEGLAFKDAVAIQTLDKKIDELMNTEQTDAILKFHVENYGPITASISKSLEQVEKVSTDELDKLSHEQKNYSRWIAIGIAVVLGAGTIVVFLLTWLIGRSITGSLSAAAAQLEAEMAATRAAANHINEYSQMLARSAVDQASAVQETAASIEQINSMVTKSAENAAQSGKVARESTEVAKRGRESSEEMLAAIHAIHESNAEIMRHTDESNKKITEITRVISEIGQKTKVINDIVFQTKLLSFNASVEAARAGEHGKGFAVVAEEVGNLAQMSGVAAKEISTMLNDSIRKVEDIVSDTKTRISHIVADGGAKVEVGSKIAEQSRSALDDIYNEVSRVNGLVGEIAGAAKEQASGINEISKAITALDQITQKNAQVSRDLEQSANELISRAQSLDTVVASLKAIIGGKGKKGPQASSDRPSSDTSAGPQADLDANAVPADQPSVEQPPADEPFDRMAGNA